MTALSHTLNCSVGSYLSVCQREGLERDNIKHFCYSQCGAKSRHCGLDPKWNRQTAVKYLKQRCRFWGQHTLNESSVAEELHDMARDTRRLPHAQYLSTAMNSRFCLVAPGEWSSTHKTTEAMALGGAGGCIPVYVIKGTKDAKGMAQHLQAMLPYSRWLDYCTVGYLVSEKGAATRMSAVLDMLSQVSNAEASEKLRALREVRDAFVFRSGSTVASPTAAEYIVGEICDVARRFRRQTGPPAVIGGDHSRCLLA